MYSRKGKLGISWYSDFVLDGKRYKKAWGRVTKTRASKKEREFKRQIENGEYEKKKNKIEFEKFLIEHLKNVKKEKKLKTYVMALNSAKVWMYYLRGKRLEVVKRKDGDIYKLEKVDAKEKITYLSYPEKPSYTLIQNLHKLHGISSFLPYLSLPVIHLNKLRLSKRIFHKIYQMIYRASFYKPARTSS